MNDVVGVLVDNGTGVCGEETAKSSAGSAVEEDITYLG
jgi:hypothetical protein